MLKGKIWLEDNLTSEQVGLWSRKTLDIATKTWRLDFQNPRRVSWVRYEPDDPGIESTKNRDIPVKPNDWTFCDVVLLGMPFESGVSVSDVVSAYLHSFGESVRFE